MAIIKKTFTYSLPDDYLAQTNTEEKTAEWTYEGPDKLYVFIENETGLLRISSSFIPTKETEEEAEGARVRAGLDHTAVLLDVNNSDLDALVASLYIGKDTGRSAGYPQKEYKIDGVTYYERPEPTSPDHTYQASEIYYDLESGAWKTPFKWLQPWITIEQHTSVRDSILESAISGLDDPELSEEVLAKMPEYIEKLKNTYIKFAGWAPHMIPFPDDPRTEAIEGFTW